MLSIPQVTGGTRRSSFRCREPIFLRNVTDLPTSVSGGTALAVTAGRIAVIAGISPEPASLAWPEDIVRVTVNGAPIDGTRCRVRPGDHVDVALAHSNARTDYRVRISQDRMQAFMTVDVRAGVQRSIDDCDPTHDLRLQIVETPTTGTGPTLGDVTQALQKEGVAYGIDRDAVQKALDEPGVQQVVASGREPIFGTDGSLAITVDLDAIRLKGVTVGTSLIEVTPKKDGVPGIDVTGKELAVPAVKNVKIRLGEGVAVDGGRTVVATVDGAPEWSPETGLIAVRHELFLDEVDAGTGNVEFSGSVHVRGDVGEGRRVTAGHRLYIGGNVDRGHLESGDTMQVMGTVMSSVLRAGGERAVAAKVVDRIESIPSDLATANIQASELRLNAEERGSNVSYGLSVQLILERMYRYVFTALDEVAAELHAAGEKYDPVANDISRWKRSLATAAISSITPETFGEVIHGLGMLVADYRSLVEKKADLVVGYVQSSEIEATGMLTLTGKGAINSHIVAWEGLATTTSEGIVRGGSLTAHGPVRVSEIGSPGGSTMQVVLGKEALLEAGRAYAGTVISSKGGSHRFIADRAHVSVRFDDTVMNVESLAA
jgi:hypothetical protein